MRLRIMQPLEYGLGMDKKAEATVLFEMGAELMSYVGIMWEMQVAA